jgi:hypothetical protein
VVFSLASTMLLHLQAAFYTSILILTWFATTPTINDD